MTFQQKEITSQLKLKVTLAIPPLSQRNTTNGSSKLRQNNLGED